jgi:hypothetical protein
MVLFIGKAEAAQRRHQLPGLAIVHYFLTHGDGFAGTALAHILHSWQKLAGQIKACPASGMSWRIAALCQSKVGIQDDPCGLPPHPAASNRGQ